jgi:ATP/ADP translocase
VLQLFATSRAMLARRRDGAVRDAAREPARVRGDRPLAGDRVYQVVEMLRRMLQFAFDKPARELLYTPLDSEAKYVSKAIVDTAALRSPATCSARRSTTWWRALALGPVATICAYLPLLASWLLLGRWLGRECTRRASG